MATKKRNYSSIVAALILFYMAEPYFIWHNFMSTIYVKTVLAFIVGGLFFMNRRKWTTIEIILFIWLLGTLILYPFVSRHNFNFFLPLLPVAFIPFASETFSRDVFKWFLNIYVVMVGAALVFWLIMLIGLLGPIGTMEPLNALKSYNYKVYPLFVQSIGTQFMRFHGPFDEPGVIGTLSGILLSIEGFNLKEKKSLILLLSGLCSLSFFFYVIVGFYFVFYNVVQKRSFSRLMFMLLLFFGGFFIIQSVPVLHDSLGTRFVWDSEKGTFAGDNRFDYSLAEDYFNQIIGTSQFWFGIDDKEGFMAAVEGSSSFISVIILNGMFFVLIYILFFVFYSLYYRKRWSSFVLFIVVFIATIYQRPNTFHIVYVFLFACFAKLDILFLLACDDNV